MQQEEFEAALARAREGDEAGLAALYRWLRDPVLRYLRFHEPREAEDLASEVWLDVAAGLRRFDGDAGGFRAWVFAIAFRRVGDARRRARRRQTEPMAQVPDRAALDDPSGEILASSLARDALAAIHTLAPDQREALLLRVVGGLSIEEVARALGKRPGAVRVLQHRALKRLHRLLEGWDVGPGV